MEMNAFRGAIALLVFFSLLKCGCEFMADIANYCPNCGAWIKEAVNMSEDRGENH